MRRLTWEFREPVVMSFQGVAAEVLRKAEWNLGGCCELHLPPLWTQQTVQVSCKSWDICASREGQDCPGGCP